MAGSFAFTTPSTAPGAGTASQSVTFTPTDTTDYSAVTSTVSVTVNKATPSVSTWPTAGSITYGQTLASSTLTGGSGSVAGSFAFTTPSAAPGAGAALQGVTFTPSDTTDYSTVISTVSVTVNKATATVTLGSLAQTYTGSPLAVTTTTNPAGLAVNFTYNGSSTAPTALGSYTVVGTISDAIYSGTAAGTLVISKATATVTLGSLAQTYSGSSLAATAITSPAGQTVNLTYNGSSTAPTAAGNYTVVGTIGDANYTGTATGTLAIGQTTSAVSVASSANTAVVTNAIIYTATVSSTVGTPTGTVNFLDGTTLLGRGSLSSGVATLATSSLAVGSHSITAVYSGDTNFVASASGPLTQIVLDFNLNPVSGSGDSGGSGSGSGTSQTVVPGGSATYTLALLPTAGTVLPAPVNLSVSGMPAGATAIITPSSWTQLTSTSWLFPANTPLTDISLAIQLPSSTASLNEENLLIKRLPPVLLGLLLLPFAGKLRRAGKRLGRTISLLLLLAVGMTVMAGLSGCGSNSGFFGQQQKTYTVLVTATSGTLSHSTTVTLTVK
jgi:hypothetical protein